MLSLSELLVLTFLTFCPSHPSIQKPAIGIYVLCHCSCYFGVMFKTAILYLLLFSEHFTLCHEQTLIAEHSFVGRVDEIEGIKKKSFTEQNKGKTNV